MTSLRQAESTNSSERQPIPAGATSVTLDTAAPEGYSVIRRDGRFGPVGPNRRKVEFLPGHKPNRRESAPQPAPRPAEEPAAPVAPAR